jgi:hypothetical protein
MYTLKSLPMTAGLVCSAHLHYGRTPCPWPECANGIVDDEFELGPELFGGENTQFKRHRWTSPTGQPYYSWLHDAWKSSFLEAPGIVDREMIRLGIRPSTSGKIAYHYTNLVGLKGILDSHEMWLTDYGYLNDESEMNYGLELVKERLRKAIADPQYANVATSLSAWITGLDEHKHRICISSYSLDGDSLSQWRAYGSVAIGFTINYALAGWSGECSIASVLYARADQELFLDFFINHVSQAYAEDLKKIADKDYVEKLYLDGAHTAINLVASFKNEGFADERELRVAYVENPEFVKIGMTPALTRFRVSGDAIVPYVTTSDLTFFQKESKLPIMQIVVGPKISPLGEKSIKEYLAHLGMGNVQVRRSSIPYRESR